MTIDGLTIEGDILSTEAKITFSPELLESFKTEPFTATKNLGQEIGRTIYRSAVNAEVKPEGLSAEPRQTADIILGIATEIDLTFDRLPDLIDNVDRGIGQEAEELKIATGFSSLIKLQMDERLLETAGAKQSTAVQELTDFFRALNQRTTGADNV